MGPNAEQSSKKWRSRKDRAKIYEHERHKDVSAGGAAMDLSALVQLRRQVRYKMESTGWDTLLVWMDGMLSVTSVAVYVVTTYNLPGTDFALSTADLALACYFGVYWLLRLWLADSRFRYVFSTSSLIDAVTILPVFISYNSTCFPGLFFLRILRILRVLRLFNMTRATNRLESAVFRSAVNLGLTMLSMMVVAAALFLEAERLGPNKDDPKVKILQFHEAIYWATITLTTVGYGDYSPTWWATQTMVIVVLLIAFTVLPLMTGRLVDALNTATKYQRGSYMHRHGLGGHLVFMGHLDGATMARLMDEVYHEDKGFDDRHSVFLSPLAPSLAVRRVLLSHPHSAKMTYLQGTPFRQLDLERTCVEYAEAVFIVCDKYAKDAATEDRRHSLALLAVGQYLGEKAVDLHYKHSMRLSCFTFWKPQPPATLPHIVIQLLLPESRQALQANLQVLSGQSVDRLAVSREFMAAQLDEAERARWEARVRESAQSWKQAAANAARRPPPGERGPGPGAGAGEALGGAAARWPSQPAMSSRWSIHRAPSGDNPAAHGAAASFVSALTARMRQRRSGSGGGAPHSYEELGDENVERAINIVTGAAFWLRLGQGVEAVCVGELRGALLAHSLLGCPGVATLLGNLCHTVNEGHVPMKQRRDTPKWLRAYIEGASQEFYEVPSFPPCLVGATFRLAAAFVYDEVGALLVATDAAAARGGVHLHIMPLDQIITDDMCAFIIADDVRQALSMMDATQEAYDDWLAQYPWRDFTTASSAPAPPPPAPRAEPPAGPPGPPAVGAGGGQRGAELELSFTSPEKGQQQQQQQQQAGGSAGGGDIEAGLLATARGVAARSVPLSRLAGGSGGGFGDLAAFVPQRPRRATATLATGRAEAASASNLPSLAPQPPSPRGLAARSTPLAARSNPLSRAYGPRWAAAAPMRSRKSLSLETDPSEATPPMAGSTDGSGRRRIVDSSAALRAAAAAAGVSQALSYALPAHLLRAASRQGRDIAEAFIEKRYHCRGPEEALGASGIVLEGTVPFRGHVLIFGPISSIEGLFSLLAPLRSKRLLRWRPVVILDTELPEPGSAWDDIARLRDVWFVQGSAHSAPDLLRANAEHAARGILLPRFEEANEEDAALEMAALSDGSTIETWQQLKTINPGMELLTEMMMASDMAYLYPVTPIPGLKLMQVGLSPAYMAGAVLVAHTMDSLAIQAYTNHGAHKIILKLMHQWHSGDARLLSKSMGAATGWRATSLLVEEPGGAARDGVGQGPGAAEELQGPDPEEVGEGSVSSRAAPSAVAEGVEPPGARGGGADGTAPPPPPGAAPPGGAAGAPRGRPPPAPGAARAGNARGGRRELLHAPTVVLVSVDAPFTDGWSYGAYWHDLLQHQGMLALGLYRRVRQQGLAFDCVTTNPAPDTPLRPGDRAFVITNLDFAAAAAGDGSSAWPSAALGFDHDLSAEEFAEFEAASAALLRRQGGAAAAAVAAAEEAEEAAAEEAEEAAAEAAAPTATAAGGGGGPAAWGAGPFASAPEGARGGGHSGGGNGWQAARRAAAGALAPKEAAGAAGGSGGGSDSEAAAQGAAAGAPAAEEAAAAAGGGSGGGGGGRPAYVVVATRTSSLESVREEWRRRELAVGSAHSTSSGGGAAPGPVSPH